MMDKYLANVYNRKLQKILERAANHNWKLMHIKGKNNKICDALSRLCNQIYLYTHKYASRYPRLLPISKRASVRQKTIRRRE